MESRFFVIQVDKPSTLSTLTLPEIYMSPSFMTRASNFSLSTGDNKEPSTYFITGCPLSSNI
jgi:hypothetical protein